MMSVLCIILSQGHAAADFGLALGPLALAWLFERRACEALTAQTAPKRVTRSRERRRQESPRLAGACDQSQGRKQNVGRRPHRLAARPVLRICHAWALIVFAGYS